ncbi:uncharacterized protein isoform X1 [Leptinotarsa decemlineata]|uniref:uncharacterized protein isoform X1 n=1 Tax=Leptinotarsa decemlineata TaxID=7539 RepID=UPI003D307223
MVSKIWATSNNGTIQYMSLTEEYIEKVLEVLKRGFYTDESVCKALNLASDEDAMAELNKLVLCVAKDGMSVIAVEKETNTVCAVAVNKLQVKSQPGGDSFFTNFAKSCKNPLSRFIINYMNDADDNFDLFEHCKVDCLLETMFLGTHPEFRRRGISSKICEVTTEVARRLLHGENVKVSLDGTELKLEPVPKLVAALFTSPQSRAIGKSAGWKVATTIQYKDSFYQGKSLASAMEDTNRTSQVYFKRLQ